MNSNSESENSSENSSDVSSEEFDEHHCLKSIIRRYENPMRNLSMTSSIATTFVFKDKRLADFNFDNIIKELENCEISFENLEVENPSIQKNQEENLIHSTRQLEKESTLNTNINKDKNSSDNLSDSGNIQNKKSLSKVKHSSQSLSLDKINMIFDKNNSKNNNIIKSFPDEHIKTAFQKMDIKNKEKEKVNRQQSSKSIPYSKSFSNIESLLSSFEAEYNIPSQNSELVVNNCIISPSINCNRKRSIYKGISYKKGRLIKREIEVNQKHQLIKKYNMDKSYDDGKSIKDIIIKNLNNTKISDPGFPDDSSILSSESFRSVNTMVDTITNQPANTDKFKDNSSNIDENNLNINDNQNNKNCQNINDNQNDKNCQNINDNQNDNDCQNINDNQNDNDCQNINDNQNDNNCQNINDNQNDDNTLNNDDNQSNNDNQNDDRLIQKDSIYYVTSKSRKNAAKFKIRKGNKNKILFNYINDKYETYESLDNNNIQISSQGNNSETFKNSNRKLQNQDAPSLNNFDYFVKEQNRRDSIKMNNKNNDSSHNSIYDNNNNNVQSINFNEDVKNITSFDDNNNKLNQKSIPKNNKQSVVGNNNENIENDINRDDQSIVSNNIEDIENILTCDNQTSESNNNEDIDNGINCDDQSTESNNNENIEDNINCDNQSTESNNNEDIEDNINCDNQSTESNNNEDIEDNINCDNQFTESNNNEDIEDSINCDNQSTESNNNEDTENVENYDDKNRKLDDFLFNNDKCIKSNNIEDIENVTDYYDNYNKLNQKTYTIETKEYKKLGEKIFDDTPESPILKKAYSASCLKDKNNINSKVDTLYSMMHSLQSDINHYVKNEKIINQQISNEDNSKRVYNYINKRVKQIYQEFKSIKYYLSSKSKEKTNTNQNNKGTYRRKSLSIKKPMKVVVCSSRRSSRVPTVPTINEKTILHTTTINNNTTVLKQGDTLNIQENKKRKLLIKILITFIIICCTLYSLYLYLERHKYIELYDIIFTHNSYIS